MPSGDELTDYLHFTGKQRRDTALHLLEGFLAGLCLDHAINPKEHQALGDWIFGHERLAEKDSVFGELLSTLKTAMADGILTPEEIGDITALCQRAKSSSIYYDSVTHAVQELHGILHGAIADLVLNEAELVGIQDWLEEHSEIRGIWPVTEIEAIVVKVMSDRKIDQAEQRLMLRYFAEFVPDHEIRQKLPPLLPTELTIKGVCAVDPQIVFTEKVFCFTGSSSKGPRKVFAETVTARSGIFVDTVRSDLDYLIIGDEGNPCWAFSCYGRKVERAAEMRRGGHRILWFTSATSGTHLVKKHECAAGPEGAAERGQAGLEIR